MQHTHIKIANYTASFLECKLLLKVGSEIYLETTSDTQQHTEDLTS